MPPDTHNTELHFHSAREEAWFVRSGHGTARLGEEAHPLREGSFWLRTENTGVGHRIEVGSDGMQLVTIGDLIPGDVCVYPEKRTIKGPAASNCPTDASSRAATPRSRGPADRSAPAGNLTPDRLPQSTRSPSPGPAEASAVRTPRRRTASSPIRSREMRARQASAIVRESWVAPDDAESLRVVGRPRRRVRTPVRSRTARGAVLEKYRHQVADREDANGVITVNHG